MNAQIEEFRQREAKTDVKLTELEKVQSTLDQNYTSLQSSSKNEDVTKLKLEQDKRQTSILEEINKNLESLDE